MMKRRLSAFLMIIMTLIFLFASCNIDKSDENSNQRITVPDKSIDNVEQTPKNETSIYDVEWQINIFDLETKEPIKNAYIGILDLNKKYQITSDKNILILPKKPTPETGSYPYGYTTITMAEGYIPAINHNLPDSTGKITI